MSVWKLIKLDFGRSPAHFGELGIGMEETSDRVRSDSLFSAWISVYARLFGKTPVEELLHLFPTHEQQKLTPPFRISSTFIYRQIENKTKTIYYLPRPLKFPHNYPNGDIEFFKTYKKLGYLPLEIWQKWYQGTGFDQQADTNELIEQTNKGKSTGKLNELGTFDYSQACKKDKVPKIAVDRVTRSTNLYHTGFVQFAWEKNPAGLYFLLQINPEGQNYEGKLHAALELLGEEGLGGERSSGAGRFKLTWCDLPADWHDLINFKQGNSYSTLSLYWDSNIQPEDLDQASYEIIERGGWIAENQVRRKMVRMFKEGSVFPNQPQGKLADVTPSSFKQNYHIYRSGISLSLPIKVKEEQ